MADDIYVSFGADTGQFEAGIARAKAEVNALAREMRQTASEMQKSGADMDSALGGHLKELGSSMAEAKNSMAEMRKAMRETADEGGESVLGKFAEALKAPFEAIEGIKGSLEGFATLVAGAFAVKEIYEFAEGMAQLGFQTEKAMAILGASPEEIGGLSAIAAATGSSLDQLEMHFSRLSRGITEESKQTRIALATLGLSFADLAGKSSTEQLETLADAFQKLPAGALRTATAVELFGRAGADMLPMLSEGAEGIREWQKVAEETGTTLDDKTVASMARTHKALTELGLAFEGVKIKMMSGWGADLASGLTTFLEEFRTIIPAANEVAAGWRIVWVEITTGFALLGERSVAAGKMLGSGFTGAGTVVKDVFVDIADGIKQFFSDLIASAIAAAKSIGQIFVDLGSVIKGAFTGHAGEAFDALKGDASAGMAAVEGAFGGTKFDFSNVVRDQNAAAAEQKSIIDGMKKDEDDIAQKAIGRIKSILEASQAEQSVATATDKTGEGTKKAAEAAADLRRRVEEVMQGFKGSGDSVDDLQKKIETLNEALRATKDAAGSIGTSVESGGGGGAYGPAATGGKSFLSTLLGAESGGRNVANTHQGTSSGQAQGYFQITTGTWDEFGGRKYSPTPMGADYSQQAAIAGQIPMSRWDPKTLAALRASGYSVDPSQTLGQNVAANSDDFSRHTPVYSGDDRKKMETARDQLEDQKTKAEEKGAGGSDIDKQTLANLQAEVAGRGDALKAQEAIVKATEDELGKMKSGEERRTLETKLADERLKLTKLENDAKEAGLNLDLQRAKSTGDPGAEHAAATRVADQRIAQAKAQYGADSAEYKRAVGEKEAADRRFVEETNRLAKQAADEEIKQVRETANEKRKALDDALSHHRITASQWLSQSQSLSQQEASDIQALYQKELDLAGQTVEQKVALKNKEADALRQISNQEADANRRAADQSQSEWESSVGGILSSFTSAMKGMISGHETFRQAMLKALENLGNKFADMVEKMVVKWIAGELSHTAATTAGVAARTAAEASGSAVNVGAIAAGALKAVSTGAGQTFAGVSGFLAPIMGPAALGPAAMAEATVLSVGSGLVSADIGMWKVPGDMPALIHRNEMIIPAGPAAAMRDMFSNGGAGGGSGVSVNPRVSFNVSSMDSANVAKTLMRNNGAVVKAVHQAVRSGAHLGLRGLQR